jgi:hypothetical protein
MQEEMIRVFDFTSAKASMVVTTRGAGAFFIVLSVLF